MAARDDLVTWPEAFLVDVYDTILTCDFEVLRRELPVIAGVEAQAWNEGYARLGPAMGEGRLSMGQAFEQILQACGAEPRPELVSELVRQERALLLESSRLFDDAIPFLQMLRSRGIMIALVSNCVEDTRELLSGLGVSTLADSVVLSCEIGCSKPSAEIYQHALDQLGVAAGAAVFVDDQPAFCAGAVAVGMKAMQIVRGETPIAAPPTGTTIIRSLLQAEARL
jgi:HAD superfamily hydrolase (TIGR01509 family)